MIWFSIVKSPDYEDDQIFHDTQSLINTSITTAYPVPGIGCTLENRPFFNLPLLTP
jgi:hypothetical protein